MKPAWKPIKVKLGQIKAWDKNPRMSTKAQAQRIIASERKFGQPVPFLISPDFLLYDGHQRLSAWFTVYGADYEMDAMQSDRPLSEDEHKELVITLHTGATGSWNWENLSSWSAGDLQEWGMNADALKGWNNDANNLKELLAAEVEPVDSEPQIDRAAELQEKWKTSTGQLWKLGNHRLLIGDCTVRENVERLMGGERADICVSDPPYGVLDEEWDRYFEQSDFDMIASVTNGMIALFNAAKPEILLRMLSINPIPQRVGVWRYSQIMPRPGMIWSWQPVFYWNCKEAKAWDSLDWYQGNSNKDGTHPTQKPIEFFEKIISSVDCKTVYEPFAGSGTTIIAAHNLNRRCYAMEISEKYGAVILERFFTATGITPELVE